MGWKQLEYKDRWSLVMSAIQAAATVGMFVVTLVGIWKVAPIITYQIEQQQTTVARTEPKLIVEPVTDPFVVTALAWWVDQVQRHQRIVELIDAAEQNGGKVSYEIVAGGGKEIAQGISPDLLVVTSTVDGKKEVVSVPVNENAMSPSQYLRYQINKGAFRNLPKATRKKVELALERYINRDMVPKVPPLIVRPGMSMQQLRSEVAMNQHHREEALRHLRGLEEVLAAARK